MRFEEIELLAVRKEPLPKYSPLEDRQCYSCMQDLYRGFYNKRINQEEAKKQKKQIKRSFLKAQETHSRYAAALAQYQEFLRLAGRYRPEILGALKRHAEPAEAMRLMADCIASLCQDKVFAQRAVKLLEKEYNDKGKK